MFLLCLPWEIIQTVSNVIVFSYSLYPLYSDLTSYSVWDPLPACACWGQCCCHSAPRCVTRNASMRKTTKQSPSPTTCPASRTLVWLSSRSCSPTKKTGTSFSLRTASGAPWHSPTSVPRARLSISCRAPSESQTRSRLWSNGDLSNSCACQLNLNSNIK